MTDGVFIDIQNVGCIKKANARFDYLTLLTGTDTNAIFTFVDVLYNLCTSGESRKEYPESGGDASITHHKVSSNKCYLFDFLQMSLSNRKDMFNGTVNMKTYLKQIKNTEFHKYDTVILYMPEICLSVYDSLLLTHKVIKFLCKKKSVDTIVVTQAPYIMELVAYYGDYLFHKYDINCNCCIAENGVIECGSHKDEGDRSAMLEKAFKMYDKSFILLDNIKDKTKRKKIKL